MNFINYDSKIDLSNKQVIGVDEVGVGDYFGPLVSCSVLIKKENKQKVIDLGIKDSKKMTDKKIMEIVPKLFPLVESCVYRLTPKGYNSINKYNNANEIKAFTHIKVINDLEKKLQAFNINIDAVFIDQYSTYNTIINYFQKHLKPNNFGGLTAINYDIYLAHKAESLSVEVAAASMIARYNFLIYMKQLEEELGIKIPLGSGNNVKQFAKQFFSSKEKQKQKNSLVKLSFKME
ncbi:ribonuclease HIII [Mycoplasma phocimorsus]|uniref:ribonuclease HIII n=1 Tax=Mycoplasma phocimorsus TaxID=3045839 RepID=UPI0024BF81C3|nr:ribonuclease HIII [Mycoplasma phocimorsus]MDJ1646176.1 ribonuclease HIII [Mycoplasma phocimorsus]